MKVNRKFKIKPSLDVGTGYAWRYEDGLCCWAEPFEESLLASHSKPSPGAEIIEVCIIEKSDYTKLVELAGANVDKIIKRMLK